MHQKIKFIPMKIHETVVTRAASFSPDTQQQIVCRLGLCPRPHWGSLQRSPRPPSWISRDLFIREGREGKGEGRKGKRGRREGSQVLRIPLAKILDPPPLKMGGRRVYLGTADVAAYSGAYMFCLRFIFVFSSPQL